MAGEIPIVIFRLDEQQYALACTVIRRILQAVEIAEIPNMPKSILGVINVEGEIITVNDIRQHFGLPHSQLSVKDFIVIVESASGPFGFVVNDIDFAAVSKREISCHGTVNVIKSTQGLIYLLDAEQLIQQQDWDTLQELTQKNRDDKEIGKRDLSS
ncbi:MAG: chemotaxis protein CheW [Proteobacteria bacterium]|nr:chemotaxis protein CheW [Pseudomonadota bacterium]